MRRTAREQAELLHRATELFLRWSNGGSRCARSLWRQAWSWARTEHRDTLYSGDLFVIRGEDCCLLQRRPRLRGPSFWRISYPTTMGHSYFEYEKTDLDDMQRDGWRLIPVVSLYATMSLAATAAEQEMAS